MHIAPVFVTCHNCLAARWGSAGAASSRSCGAADGPTAQAACNIYMQWVQDSIMTTSSEFLPCWPQTYWSNFDYYTCQNKNISECLSPHFRWQQRILKYLLLRRDDQLNNVFCFFIKNLKAKLLLVWKFYSCFKVFIYLILAFCARIGIEICLTRGCCFFPEKPLPDIQVLSTHVSWSLLVQKATIYL